MLGMKKRIRCKGEMDNMRERVKLALDRTVVPNVSPRDDVCDLRDYIDVPEAIEQLRSQKIDVESIEHLNMMVKSLEQKIESIDKDTEDMYYKHDLVDCEGCGCLIRRDRAIRGESVIEKESGIERDMAVLANYTIGTPAFTLPEPKESIREVFWCKCCGEDV